MSATEATSLADWPLARTCSAEGCDRSGKLTRGMCAKHYRYWIDHTPKDRRPPTPRDARSFWDFVDRSGDCWVWTGPTNRKGYGFWSGGGVRGLAHRLSLAAETPCPDDSLLACHRCDNPPCVNPAHLYWGTAKDNARDLAERQGIYNKGSFKIDCPRGHLKVGDNRLVVKTKGGEKIRCRTCELERKRKSDERRRRAMGIPARRSA